MMKRFRAIWALPGTVADDTRRVQRALDDLTQAMRDLEATIKTYWTNDPAAKRPAKPQDVLDPHGL